MASSKLKHRRFEQSYYRWRREYGGLKLDQTKRLKELEREREDNNFDVRGLSPNPLSQAHPVCVSGGVARPRKRYGT